MSSLRLRRTFAGRVVRRVEEFFVARSRPNELRVMRASGTLRAGGGRMMKIKAFKGAVRASIQAAAFAIVLPHALLMGCAPKERTEGEGDGGAPVLDEGGTPGITPPHARSAAGGMSSGGTPAQSMGGDPDPS